MIGSEPITARIKATVAIGNNQSRPRFHLIRFAEFRKARSVCAANHLARRTQRRSCDVQIIFVVLGEILNLRALRRCEQKPRRFLLSPCVPFVLREEHRRKARAEPQSPSHPQKNHHAKLFIALSPHLLVPLLARVSQSPKSRPQGREDGTSKLPARVCHRAHLGTCSPFCMILSVNIVLSDVEARVLGCLWKRKSPRPNTILSR